MMNSDTILTDIKGRTARVSKRKSIAILPATIDIKISKKPEISDLLTRAVPQ
jgi:hypothetical protein